MPRPAVDYVPRTYVRPAYEPDTRTLMDLLRLSGASRAQAEAQKGQNRAAGLFTIGKLISDALGGIQDERMQKSVLAQRQGENDRDEAFRRDQLASVEADRVERRQMAEAAAAEKSQADAYRRGGQISESVEYGPLDESQVDDVMAGPAAGRARYAFGPGTSDGPELQPSPSQQRGIQSQQALEKMGAIIGPNGQVVMPEKPVVAPTPESRLSGEDLLAYLAAQGNQGAINALKVKREQRPPTGQASTPDQQFVIRGGKVTPITKGSAQPGDVPYSADAMQGMGGEAADVRSLRTAAALNSIDKLKTLAPKRLPGLPGMVQGAAAKAQGLAGYNTGARQYEALLQPTAMQMAVAIQGAAGLSNSEREAMAKMLGNIATMDYETQIALLENASEMIRSGADVALIQVKDPKTGEKRDQWVPKRSRMPGEITIGQQYQGGAQADLIDALIKKYGGG